MFGYEIYSLEDLFFVVCMPIATVGVAVIAWYLRKIYKEMKNGKNKC